jgi:DNA-binding NarL/FixJ family response regulator
MRTLEAGDRAAVGAVRVVVGDDQPSIRDGMSAVLAGQPDMAVVGRAAGAAETLALVRDEEPDVVVLEVCRPGIDGVGLIREITDGRPTRVLAVADRHSVGLVTAALRAGASGFLCKPNAGGALPAAVRAIAAAGTWLDPVVTGDLLHEMLSLPVSARRTGVLIDDLTLREREILVLLARGLDSDGIARRLVLSQATIRTHIGHILDKLGCHTRTHAVVMAYRTGLVRLNSAA